MCLPLVLALPGQAVAQPAAVTADETSALRAEIAALKVQLQAMEARLDAVVTASSGAPTAPVASAAPPAATPVLTVSAPRAAPVRTSVKWRGAPDFTLDDRSFKAKGRIQFDSGLVRSNGRIEGQSAGLASEARRIRLGAEGNLGGDFGYKLEIEFSDNSVDLVDTFISYTPGDFVALIGNQNQFQSFDEVIGDTTGSFMERAAFTDAFGFERRLGVSLQYVGKELLLQGGVFADSIDSIANDSEEPGGGGLNDSASFDGRIIYAPQIGPMRLHLGASLHWRELNNLAQGTQRYRQRPYLHAVNFRPIDTGELLADSEMHYGLELAGSRKQLYFAGEVHWLEVSRPGMADPRFFGGYAEVGYFLTRGDTRPWRGGLFDRTDPARPVTEGGPGAIQIGIRYDHLDMNSLDIVGGTQDAVFLAAVWTPINYLRFNINYGHLFYNDARTAAGIRAKYEADVLGVRAELDF